MGGRVCCLFSYLQSAAFSWCRAWEEGAGCDLHPSPPRSHNADSSAAGRRRHCPRSAGHLPPRATGTWRPPAPPPPPAGPRHRTHALKNRKKKKKKSKVADFLSAKQPGAPSEAAAWEGGSRALAARPRLSPSWCCREDAVWGTDLLCIPQAVLSVLSCPVRSVCPGSLSLHQDPAG